MKLFNSTNMRTAMAYTNEVGDKIYPVIVDIKRGIKSTEEIQFMSSDINTGILSVAFIQGADNYNVSGAEVICSVMRPDASTLDIPCTIVENNIVEVPLGINGTSQDGVYSFDFKVFKGGNKVVGTPIMNYSVSLSISNDTVVEEDDRLPVLTVLMTQITTLKNETKDVISTANTAIQNANKATDDTKLAISNAQSATQEAEDVITRVNNAIASGTQDLEVIDARDGEVSLKARLDRDIEKAKQIYVGVEGSHISTDSPSGYLKDVEILGNTIQDASNLADIRSVGDKVEGQELYEIPVLSRGKNLLNSKMELGTISGGLINTSSTNQIRTVDFVRLKPNTDYVISGIPNYTVIFCTKNCEYITEVGRQGGTKFTTPENCEYIKFRTYSSDNITNINTNIQLEEGTVATEYEPYQEDKITILSPTPLEKVGDVADRIIEKDGVWGVEKNVETIYTKEFANGIGAYEDKGGTYRWGLNLDTPKTFLLTNFLQTGTLSTESTQTQVMLYDHGAHREFRIAFKKSDFPNFDIKSNVVDYLSNETRFIKIVQQPTFIPLPHDQQVKLRTFANKTNISFGCEIEGTIKAQVPKSIGATVNTHTEQISNLNKELDRVKKLEESTVSTVETESDFTTVEATSNGYFEDVKLEGKTLVNLSNLPSGDITLINSFGNGRITPLKQLTSSDTLYLMFNCTSINSDADLGIIYSVSYKDDTPAEYKTIENHKTVGYKKVKIIPKSDVQHINIFLHGDNSSSARATISDVMLMYEKDYDTQNPSSYFEGLKSVGDGTDEIVVSSVKFNTNMLNPDDFSSIEILDDGTFKVIGVYSEGKTVEYQLKPNCVYNLKWTRVDGSTKWLKTSVNGEVLAGGNGDFIFTTDCTGKIIFNCGYNSSNDKDMLIKDFCIIEKGGNYVPYTPHQSDKKRLLFYNNETQTWEKPVLREWDSIEKHSDGKYYYHQRSGEVVLNGSENWVTNETFSTGDYIACLSNSALSDKKQGVLNIISDKFNTKNCALIPVLEEGMWGEVGNSVLYMSISKSKLSTQDVEGFKQWLQANNVTVVYQLAQEKVYECTIIDLITYTDETNYIVESGVISPKTTLKVHNNISNVVKILQEKVSLLESNIKASQEVQDMMILETDMRMLDIELALMEFAPMKLNLGGSDMLRSATYFNFLKNHIINETYEKGYLENVMNKYLATGRMNQDEYDELYKMLYPPVYDIELPIEP